VKPAEKTRVIEALSSRSGGEIKSFFAAHGLASAYDSTQNDGYGRAKKTADALAAAERMGTLDDVLGAASAKFLGTPRHEGRPARIAAALSDLAVDLDAWEWPKYDDVTEWIERFNEQVGLLDGLVGDDSPAKLDVLPGWAFDSHGNPREAGLRRLHAAVDRALQAAVTAAGTASAGTFTPEVSSLHPRVVAASATLLAGGHGDNAVEEVCKALAERVRGLSGLSLDGSTLMQQAFSEKHPRILLNATADESGESEQRGYMWLASGLMAAGRNPRAHRPAGDYDEVEVSGFLAVASLIEHRLDRYEADSST
jgi:uncharacterized protein (TIGR02391 family)